MINLNCCQFQTATITGTAVFRKKKKKKEVPGDYKIIKVNESALQGESTSPTVVSL